MQLSEVIEKLDEFDADQVIYVVDNAPDAQAVVDYETDDGRVPSSASGMQYLLEVSLARDATRVWSDWRNGRQPTLDEKIRAIVYYAENDSFMPAS